MLGSFLKYMVKQIGECTSTNDSMGALHAGICVLIYVDYSTEFKGPASTLYNSSSKRILISFCFKDTAMSSCF